VLLVIGGQESKETILVGEDRSTGSVDDSFPGGSESDEYLSPASNFSGDPTPPLRPGESL
jgi:hypothetical protein